MAAGRQRLDKWLWFARFAKSRTLAAKLVEGGFVRVNGQRQDNPAKPVATGDVLTVAAPGRTVVVRVLSPGERRGPAPEARTLYEDFAPQQQLAAGEVAPLVSDEPGG